MYSTKSRTYDKSELDFKVTRKKHDKNKSIDKIVEHTLEANSHKSLEYIRRLKKSGPESLKILQTISRQSMEIPLAFSVIDESESHKFPSIAMRLYVIVI